MNCKKLYNHFTNPVYLLSLSFLKNSTNTKIEPTIAQTKATIKATVAFYAAVVALGTLSIISTVLPYLLKNNILNTPFNFILSNLFYNTI